MKLQVFFITVICLILFLWALQHGNNLHFPDEMEYHQFGISLAEGHGFTLENGDPSVLRPPGYPFLLGILYRFYPEPLSGKLLNVVLFCLAVGIMCKICDNALPALFVLAYPVLFFTTTTLYPVILGGLLLLLILLLLLSDTHQKRNLILAGLLLGVLILNIPSFMLTAPILAWILFRHRQGSFVRRTGKVMVFTLCTLVVVLPWTWRNYRQFDAFIMVSANSGLNLFLGNSPNAGPNTGVNVERSDVLKVVEGMNEIDTDHYYRDQALDWIRTHPADAAKLYAAKAVNYFNFRNELKTTSQSSSLKNLVMFLSWYPLLGLFVIRLFFQKKYPLSELEKAIYLLVISNVFLSAIFFTRIRFRLPFDMLMILANAIFLSQLLPNNRFFALKPLTKAKMLL